MTSLPTAYTPLESLLLFQALRAEGVGSISFNRISEQLKAVPWVHNDPSFDSGRLDPDALRELYIRLLKEEARRDVAVQNSESLSVVDGHDGTSPRKPKASPPNVHEAAQHAHLIPRLVTRLYGVYRDNTLRSLREGEQRHSRLAHEIAEIEAGQWDERLNPPRAEQNARSATTGVSVSATPAFIEGRETPTTLNEQPLPSSNAPVTPTGHPAVPPTLPHFPSTTPSLPTRQLHQPPSSQGADISQHPSRPLPQSSIDAVITHRPESQPQPPVPAEDRRPASSNATVPESASPRPDLPSASSSSVPSYTQPASDTASQQAHHLPKLPPHVSVSAIPSPAPSQGNVPLPPPIAPHSPYAAHPVRSRPGSVGSPVLQQLPPPRPSSSPRPSLSSNTFAVPPTAAVQHPSSPVIHHTPTAPVQHYTLQHRGSSASDVQQPRAYPTTPLAPHHGVYYQAPPPPQQHPQHPLTDPRQHYVAPSPQRAPAYPPQPGQVPSFVHPPFAQDFSEKKHPTTHQPAGRQQPPPRQPTFVQPVRNLAASIGRASPHNKIVSDIVAALATPPRSQRRVHPLWKSQFQPSPQTPSAMKPRPPIEPLSPTRPPARLISREMDLDDDLSKPDELASNLPPPKANPARARNTARDRSSITSKSPAPDETLRRTTRSHSVATAVSTSHATDDGRSAAHEVKLEPSTPAHTLDEMDITPGPPSTTSATAAAAGPVTRKRRGTMPSQPPLPPSKRKRKDSPSAPSPQESVSVRYPTPPPRRTTVLATRNFAKMSSAIMNDINTHKHASYFAHAVRERDAPGYSEIVLQPQNLKSIRAAITAGSRTIAAATAASSAVADSPSTDPLSFSSSTVDLDRAIDLLPPKAIVNASQLEKEVLRMFANAFLFNPGDDGMAAITTEMYNDIAPKLTDWRRAERDAAGSTAGWSGGPGSSVAVENDDGEGDVKGKRRKGV